MTKKVVRRKAKEAVLFSPPTREVIHRLRGSYKGLGLLKALMEERAKDLEREEAKLDRLRWIGKQPREQADE